MKNIINRLLVLLLVLFVGVSLTACNKDGKDTTNKNVPFGTLSSEKVYAKVGTLTLSEKDLYNEMRVNGYDYLIEELTRTLTNPSQYDLANETVSTGVKNIIKEQCYGTSDEDALKAMNSETKAKYRAKFVDNMYLIGINVENDEEAILNNVDCQKHFLTQYAQKQLAKSALTTASSKYYWDNKTYKNDEDKDVNNPYYISEEAIESAYNSTKNAEATYNVVVVGYETLAQAQKALGSKDPNTLTAQDLVDLYKERYSYKFAEGATPTIADEVFKLTDKDLSKFNSSLSSMIKSIDEDNKNEDGTDKFTVKPYQQFGDTVYFVGVLGEKAEADYASLEGEAKINAKNETVEDIIDGKLTPSTISTILFEKLHEANVVIYDYVYDALYAAQNKNHTRLEAKDWKDEYNNVVAKINDTTITVDAFYNKLHSVLATSTTMDYFTSELLLTSEFANQVSEEDVKNNKKALDDILKSFNNDELASSGYPKSIGEDIFKFLYFGTANKDEILEFYKAQSAWSYYVKSKPENYYKVIETIGKNYVGYKVKNDDKYNGQFFDLSVKHILLTVDYNGDGTADDPEIFCKEAGIEQSVLEDAIKETMAVIANEVHYLVGEKGYASLEDALDFILKEYYKNGVVNYDNSHWDDHKSKFHFGLTIEDLESVNNSTVSQYVKEFGIGTQALYEKLKDANLLDEDFLIKEIKTANNEGNNSEENTPITVSDSDLIKTTYGYHVLAVYDSGSITSAKYTPLDDHGENYKSIKIKGEDEPINAYSDNDWASINQIKIYVSQVNTDDGVTDLPSSVKTFISNIYSDFTTRYDNEQVRNILFAETYLKIEYTDTNLQPSLAKFLEIQKRQCDSYEDFSENSIGLFANWWNIIHTPVDSLA